MENKILSRDLLSQYYFIKYGTITPPSRPIVNYDYDKNLDDIINRNGDVFSFDMEGTFALYQILYGFASF